MKAFTRSDRVSSQIQRILSEILSKDISDPRLQMVVITRVKMSQDLRNAKIYFSVSGSRDREEVAKGFQDAMGYIKLVMAPQLGLRYMPSLKFFYDDNIDYGERIENLFKCIHAEQGEPHPLSEEK